MPAIYHEGSWLGNATDPEVLVKDTVGWTGKNRAYSQTNNAVIAHIESGITYDVSWTGSATVTLKKNSASGATITSGSTSPLSFTADADYELYFGSSATVTNIMVKDSRITDPTYEPYHESVEQTLRDAEVIEGKNRLENKATSTGIFTVNSDKSITANGTYTGGANALKIADIYDTDFSGYIFNGCPSGGGYSNAYRLFYRVTKKSDGTIVNDKSAYDTGNGVALTHSIDTSTEYIQVWLQVDNNVTLSNKTFYPMISKEGGAYEPFYIPLKESKVDWTSQGVLGAKNLMPNNAKSQTINGVTFTVNSNGTITANGTATALTILIINNAYELKAGTYILSGCPVENANVQLIKTGLDIKAYINSPTTFTLSQTESGITARIAIASGQTLSNAVFKPMLRLASDPDDTYQPYTMTNRELTEKKINIADLKTVVSASSDFTDFKTRIASL